MTAFGAALAREDAVTPAELVPIAVTILGRAETARERMRERFGYVFVDDLQDAPEGAADFVDLVGGDADLMVAADPRQPPTGRHDGEGVAFATFERRHRGRRIDLSGERRRVVEADGRGRGRAVDAHLTVATDVDAEAEAIRDRIAALRASGIPYAAQVLLARTHDTLARLASRLVALGTPMLHLGDVHRRSDVRTLVAVVGLAADDDPSCLTRVAKLPCYGVPEADALASADLAARLGIGAREALERIGQAGSPGHEARAGFAHLVEDLRILTSASTSWQILSRWLFDRSGHLVRNLRDDADAGKRVSLAATHVLLAVCEEQEAQGGRGGARPPRAPRARRLGRSRHPIRRGWRSPRRASTP